LRTSFFIGEGAICPLQHGSDFSEGRRWPHHRDKGGLLVEAVAEPDEEHVDELTVVDGVAKLLEFIGDRLEFLTVDADGGITLLGVAELGVEGVDAAVDIVLEELS
jgi:hypothetical protein